jgi:anti-anti-sigma regulatory factor
MLRIQRSVEGQNVTVVLSGRIRSEDIGELERLFAADQGLAIVVDLEGVALVDRDGVRFLARSEAAGIALANCPPYVREWMSNEGTDD